MKSIFAVMIAVAMLSAWILACNVDISPATPSVKAATNQTAPNIYYRP